LDNCVFCKIVRRELPSDIIYEDDKILAFHDLDPKAPVHALIIPKEHIASMDELGEDHEGIAGWLLVKVRDIAASLGLENGYRLVNNCGADGMQTVNHLHFHLLGKRKMLWPPG
jgi:diadenosine tetraphosphate (Ap4A) HIT family hydrolase